MYWYLFPFAFLYGIVISVRNKLYDWGIFKSKQYEKPVICIGNITIGGTGKTPHTEFLINQLHNKYKVAVLSRGYKRKTKGYIEVETNSRVSEVGDEPLQMKQKFQNIKVVVDEDRQHGIEKIFSEKRASDIVLLDDAYQHRKVQAGYQILLTDYHRLITKDFLLPVGRLREHRHNRRRANCVIVTKCPSDLKPFDYRVLQKQMDLFPYQKLFFTSYAYNELISLNGFNSKIKTFKQLQNHHIIVVSGIANPKPLYNELKLSGAIVHKMRYSDHYNFTKDDLHDIFIRFNKLFDKNPIVICTEKDAVKFKELLINDYKSMPFYYLPITVNFLNNSEECFLEDLQYFIENGPNNTII